MKIISMDLLIVPQVMDQHIWQFLVPDKRFKSHKLRQFDGFVPRKRFMRYQMPRIAVFVPRKRFNRDKRHYFQEIEEMSLELHSNIKHQPSPFWGPADYLQYADNQDKTDFQHNNPQLNCHITAHAARQGHRQLTLNRSGGSRS